MCPSCVLEPHLHADQQTRVIWRQRLTDDVRTFLHARVCLPGQRKKGQEKKWPMMAELGGKKEAPLTAEKGASYR